MNNATDFLRGGGGGGLSVKHIQAQRRLLDVTLHVCVKLQDILFIAQDSTIPLHT